jgi:Pilus formation protein N terminal region
MAALLKRDRRRRRQLSLIGALLGALTFAGSTTIASPTRAADLVTVFLDQARLVRMPEHVATLVVGNPLIADVTLQAGGLMVITGKGYGTTNLIALDRSGSVLRELSIEVQGPREDVVIVYRGAERESYSCTPVCERRITLGDTPDFFTNNVGEVLTRNGSALGGMAPQQQK